MRLNHSIQTAFKTKAPEYVLSESVAENPTLPDRHSFVSWGAGNSEANNKSLKAAIKKSVDYYYLDGLVRTGIDRFGDLYKTFELESENEELLKKLNTTLNIMALETGESWQAFLKRAIQEYYKSGNVFIYKERDYNNLKSKKNVYRKVPGNIKAFWFIPYDQLDPLVLKPARKAWRWAEGKHTVPTKDYVNGTFIINDEGAEKAIADQMKINPGARYLIPGRDVVHLAYRKPVNLDFGLPISLTAVEDIVNLRMIEQQVSMCIRKFMMPSIIHKITRAPMHAAARDTMDAAITKVKRMYAGAGPDNVFVVGPNHEVEMIGGESKAMRATDYLDNFQNRALISLSLSRIEAGLETGSAQAAEAAISFRYSKATSDIEDILFDFQRFIIWEIAYSLGYDPYNNERDQVTIVPIEANRDRQIKYQAHYVDMFTKSGIDLMELRKVLMLKKAPVEQQMFHKMTEKPEAPKPSSN